MKTVRYVGPEHALRYEDFPLLPHGEDVEVSDVQAKALQSLGTVMVSGSPVIPAEAPTAVRYDGETIPVDSEPEAETGQGQTDTGGKD